VGMNGWMDARMDAWMDAWISGSLWMNADAWIDSSRDVCSSWTFVLSNLRTELKWR
jgi:hypothetical protein